MRRHSFNKGFSLVEILVVVAIIALIVGLVAQQVFKNQDRAKFRLAESQLSSLASKVESYEMDTGRLPERLTDLVKEPNGVRGWLGPYAKEAQLMDPWQQPIEYKVPGEESSFALVSQGADRKPGGDALNQDIVVEP